MVARRLPTVAKNSFMRFAFSRSSPAIPPSSRLGGPISFLTLGFVLCTGQQIPVGIGGCNFT